MTLLRSVGTQAFQEPRLTAAQCGVRLLAMCSSHFEPFVLSMGTKIWDPERSPEQGPEQTQNRVQNGKY